METGAVMFDSVAIFDTEAAQVPAARKGGVGMVVVEVAELQRASAVQTGGVVHMADGSVEFKGGRIARAKAVRSSGCALCAPWS